MPGVLDPRAIDDYLAYVYVPARITAYRDVFELAPGHRLVWQDGRVTIEPSCK